MTTYQGSCHCGRVRFRVTTANLHLSDCNCSMCTMKGNLHLIVPLEEFELVQGQEVLTTYRFNTGVAEHHFCSVCGVHPFYVPRSDPDKMDVNARCLDTDLTRFRITPFDGRHWE